VKRSNSLREIIAPGGTSHRYTQVFWIPGAFMISTTDTRNKRISLMDSQRGASYLKSIKIKYLKTYV
jgi:hypothetical protein